MPSLRALPESIRPLVSAGLGLAEQTFGLATALGREVARRALGHDDDGVRVRPVASERPPEPRPEPSTPAPSEPRPEPTIPPPAPPARGGGQTPPLPPEVKTVDDEPELVAEFGGEGAEDPAGPEIEVEQPWEGYPALTAADIVDRLAGAPAEVLTAVLLYEPHHRNRRTVMAAADARLVALENTPSASPR